MEEELLKLIYDYTKRKRSILNHQFINKLVEIVVRARSLDDYVKGVHLSTLGMTLKNYEEDNADYAAYNCADKIIKVNLPGFHYICDTLELNVSQFEQDLFHNLFVTQVILHELEHATNLKMAEDPSDKSIKTRLMRASFDFNAALYQGLMKMNINPNELDNEIVEWYRKEYESDYKIDTEERMAEIDSQATILRIIRPIKRTIPDLYRGEKAFLVFHMLKGYLDVFESGICPTELFLQNIGNEELWKSFSFYDEDPAKVLENVQKEYGLYERLEYGFPITEKEYSLLKRRIG